MLAVLLLQSAGKLQKTWQVKRYVQKQEEKVLLLEEELAQQREKQMFIGEGGYWDREAKSKLGLGREEDRLLILPEEVKVEKEFWKESGEGEAENWEKWVEVFVY